jgi:hypothetical protein
MDYDYDCYSILGVTHNTTAEEDQRELQDIHNARKFLNACKFNVLKCKGLDKDSVLSGAAADGR